MKRTTITYLLALSALLLGGCGGMPSDSSEHGKATQASASLESANSAPPTREEVRTMEAIDEDSAIYFTSRGTSVDEAGKAKLQHHAARLKRSPEKIVTLTGQTDDLGSANYNLAIAEQRTLAVARVLRSYGVPAKQIRRYSVGGEKMPIVCQSSACRAKMRRVDLNYSPQ